jgi:hypothetical protein
MALLQIDETLDLPGARIRSIGVSAQVDSLLAGEPGDVRADAPELADYGVPEDGAALLAGALAEQGLLPVLVVPVDDLAPQPGTGENRGPDEEPSLELTVAAPAEGEAQVVLEVDATGVVSWHFPVPAERLAPGDRAGLDQVFRIPIRQVDVATSPEETDRGLFGFGVRKLLQVLRYPVQWASGVAGRLLVGAWESRHRRYGLRMLDGAVSAEGVGSPLTADQVAAIDGRPTLVLVHGTFSTSRAGFGRLLADAALVTELRDRYGSRVLLFDHPSVHVNPAANARWLLEQFPPQTELVLDVVAHSRGGLVARALNMPRVAQDAGRRPPTVRTTIHVATPNAGTVLASPDRWGTLLDTMTNLATLLPDDFASAPLTAVIETVKQVGTGVLDGLDGLVAMSPGSDFLTGLGSATGTAAGTSFAIASDFEPESASLPVRALDALVDPFFGEGNDLVVPTMSVSRAAGLTVDDAVTVPRTPAIAHTSYFGNRTVRERIVSWLSGAV